VPQSPLERIVEETRGTTVLGTISIAVDRIAEEIARDVLADQEFRRSIRGVVRVRSRVLLDRLLGSRGGARAIAAPHAAIGPPYDSAATTASAVVTVARSGMMLSIEKRCHSSG
jgi:hypothetical protein